MRSFLSSRPSSSRRDRHRRLFFQRPLFRCLFLFLLAAAAVSADQSIPLLSECPTGDSTVYLLQHNSSIASGTVPLRSLPILGGFLECTELCSAANNCVGVRYTQQAGASGGGQCQLVGQKSPAGGAASEFGDEAAAAARTVTKNCVKSERICSSPFHFDVHEQKILVGFAREVVAAESIQRCLSACLNAFDTFGFECESVMFYPVDAECILNTEDRLDRPDLFVDEHEDTVIYLDNNCAGSQCYAPYVTQYVAVEGRQLTDELDHSFEGFELSECEELCTQRLSVTANDFNCKAFMYSNQTRTCVLSDERSRPLGRANLTEVPGWTYFEKKCFASPRTCRNVPSFTRVPQMLLVGFASFVMENVPSVTMCLDQCTNPPPETGQNFGCKSVMYYYNEQECILNAESRHSKPDLFIPEEDDFVVDYFDINCRLETEQCISEGVRSPKIVRTLNAALPEGDGAIHVVETVQANVKECAQKCAAHSPDKCRSFNYDKSSGICNLLYLDGRGSLRPEPKAQVDLYDLHCLESTPEGQSVGCVDAEGAAFSRHLYSQWVGGESNKELHSVPLSKCLNLCAGAVQRCEGLNYNRRNGTCELIEQLRASPGATERSDHIDFYQNVCALKEVQSEESSAANVPKSKVLLGTSDGKEGKKSGLNKNGTLSKKPTIKADGLRKGPAKSAAESEGAKATAAEVSEADIESKAFGVPSAPKDKDQQPPQPPPAKAAESIEGNGGFSVANQGPDPNQLPSPIQIAASEVHTICNYEGISVQVKHSEPFSGVMFVKNKYDTCRVEVEAKDSVTLVLGLPANFGMKPITLTSPEGNSHRRPKAHSQKSLSADRNNGTSLERTGGGEEVLESTLVELDEQQRQKHKNKRHRRQSQRDCGLVDMDNGTYKTVVVVQTNNLGIPGLVTSMDQLYEISCNYSSMLGGKVIAAANLSLQGPQPSLIQPRGKIELGNPVLMQMMPMREARSEEAAGKPSGTELREPLLQAKLGDILELRWELMAMDDELDFFVKDCYAEPGITPPKGVAVPKSAVEKLQLVHGGCPTPAVAQKLIPNPIKMLSSSVKVVHMQAFRFDSSPTVRLTCHLELCKGDCKPVNCRMVDGTKDSWGRKKRESPDNGVTEFETRRFKVPRFAQATTSLTIVDPLQKLNEPVPNPFQAHSSLSRLAAGEIDTAAGNLTDLAEDSLGDEPSEVEAELCMHKWTLGGVLGTLLALIVVQAAVVAKYMAKRLVGRTRK
ncbi:hypothetical protein GPALN_003577 [Globodera pallida]|nr:hypothetical protein GPALN_003577 [Globodera pallida]